MKNFMDSAFEQAELAFKNDEVPVGAVIVENNKIIASSHNKNLTLRDATAHAEIVAIREATLSKDSARLDNCDIYVTLEPCTMCAAAISLSRIRRVYYAASDEKFGAVENGGKFFNSKSCHHKPEVYSGISESRSQKLLIDFFKTKR